VESLLEGGQAASVVDVSRRLMEQGHSPMKGTARAGLVGVGVSPSASLEALLAPSPLDQFDDSLLRK